MYTKAIAIVLLVLAAVVTAQQTTEILDVEKVEQAGQGSLHTAKIIVLAFNLFAIGLMLGATIYILVIRKRGIPELFGEWWFWLPIALNMIPVILYIVSDFTPLFKSVYDWVKQDMCPFLFCP
jgi:hypothetical protein